MKDGDKVLVRNSDRQPWEESIFHYQYGNKPKLFFRCGWGVYLQCIPFDTGLLGKLDKPVC